MLAVDPLTGLSARVQVKSRWATDARQQFPIKNPDCDFVVYVRLNRGAKKGNSQAEKSDPEFFVLPIASVLSVRRTDGWGIARVGSIAALDDYRGSWHLIRDFISQETSLKIP